MKIKNWDRWMWKPMPVIQQLWGLFPVEAGLDFRMGCGPGCATNKIEIVSLVVGIEQITWCVSKNGMLCKICCQCCFTQFYSKFSVAYSCIVSDILDRKFYGWGLTDDFLHFAHNSHVMVIKVVRFLITL